jgi:hypothetical protein
MEAVSRENFDEWKHHPVTKQLLKLLAADREVMKEGLIQGAFTDEQEVKGRCRAIAIILQLEYEDLFDVGNAGASHVH